MAEFDEWVSSLSWPYYLMSIVVSSILLYLLFVFITYIVDRQTRPVVDQTEYENAVEETYVIPEFAVYTPRELLEYDGLDGKAILIAVQGKVYDITSHPSGRDLYGEGSAYECFRGRDATRALATTDFDDVGSRKMDDLGFFEKDTLRNWIYTFEYKYKVVGEIVYPDDVLAEEDTSESQE